MLLPLILPLALISLALSQNGFVSSRLDLWLPRGKDIIVVYSDSSIWHEYMTNEVLPLLQERAIVLNWSERNRWPRLPLRVHTASLEVASLTHWS
jgi:hypothetical protein